MDELALAYGNTGSVSYDTYIPWYCRDNNTGTILARSSWTMSPNYVDMEMQSAENFFFDCYDSNTVSTTTLNGGSYYVRPVIAVSDDVYWEGGNGSFTRPYRVELYD